MAVRAAEERLHRAVTGALLGLGGERRERDVLGEDVAERARRIRLRRDDEPAARRPLPRLAGAVRGLAQLGHAPFEEVEVHAATVAFGP